MAAKKTAKNEITLDQLLDLRQQTERLSEHLKGQLSSYLGTLRPLLAPKRFLGKYAGGSGSIAREDEVFEHLKKSYDANAGAPFGLRAGLEKEFLTGTDAELELYPWEYTHQASDNGQTSALTVTSPVRWVLTMRSEFSLAQVRQALAGKTEKRPQAMRDFVVNALVTDLVLARNPGVGRILTDLRYELKTEQSPEFGKLPLTTLAAPLASFRPADKLVLSSTRFSGVPAFIELIDMESIDLLQDPLKSKLSQIAGL